MARDFTRKRHGEIEVRSSKERCRTTRAPQLKTGIQVAQNDPGAKAHHHKQVSLRFERSSPFYG